MPETEYLKVALIEKQVMRFPLSIPVLHAKTAPGIVPFQGPRWAGNPATAAFQAARVFYKDLSCLLAHGIEPCRADGEAWLEFACAADLLANDDMRLLVVPKDVEAELISGIHHILLNLHKSLSVATLNMPSFAPFHTEEKIRSLGSSPIQKISSKSLHSHCG